LAFLLYTHALRRLKATEASVFLNLSPMLTALLAWGTLGETLTPSRPSALATATLGASLA